MSHLKKIQASIIFLKNSQ